LISQLEHRPAGLGVALTGAFEVEEGGGELGVWLSEGAQLEHRVFERWQIAQGFSAPLNAFRDFG